MYEAYFWVMWLLCHLPYLHMVEKAVIFLMCTDNFNACPPRDIPSIGKIFSLKSIQDAMNSYTDHRRFKSLLRKTKDFF